MHRSALFSAPLPLSSSSLATHCGNLLLCNPSAAFQQLSLPVLSLGEVREVVPEIEKTS